MGGMQRSLIARFQKTADLYRTGQKTIDSWSNLHLYKIGSILDSIFMACEKLFKREYSKTL